VLVGRRAALNRDFTIMLDDLRSALHRLDRHPRDPAKDLAKDTVKNPPKASSSEVDTGSRKNKDLTSTKTWPAATRIE
jgi:ribonuclease P protein component